GERVGGGLSHRPPRWSTRPKAIVPDGGHGTIDIANSRSPPDDFVGLLKSVGRFAGDPMRATLAATVLLLASPAIAAQPTAGTLEASFRDTVRPFLRSYCFECHDQQKHKGDLDLSAYATVEAV